MSARWVLGVDIGGTNLVVAALPSEGGEPVAIESASTVPERGADSAVEEIGRMADEVIAEAVMVGGGTRADFCGVGIGSPGPLDLESGVIISSPNLGWNGYPIRDQLAERLQLEAVLDNDANCATYGEWWLGAGRDVTSLFGLTLGTGIGGGYVLDGRVVRGASGSAGEIGHTTIDFTGRLCGCGNYGCLEAYASGPNIAARAHEGLKAGYESSLVEMVDGDLERITAVTVYDALMAGDEYAHDVMTETAKILGAGVANVVNALNPEMVVIVGGVTRAGDHLFSPLRSEVRRRAFPSAVDSCRIVPGELPATAGVIGAAGIFAAEHGIGP